MKRGLILTLILSIACVGATAQTPKKKGSFLKHVAIAAYKSPEAFLYAAVNVVGAAVDTAERVVAGVHTAVSKVDDVLDKAEGAINPVGGSQPQTPSPGGTAPTQNLQP